MQKTSIDNRLLGHWVSETGMSERVTIDFGRDGQMVYTIHAEGKVQKIFLEFTTRDGVIVTDQPSQARKEETNYEITADKKLVLNYQGEVSTFVRLK